MEEKKKVSLETMTGTGKKRQIAGREYLILPVNIIDMKYVMGNEDADERVIILDKKQMENEKDINWQIFGLNITEPKRRKTFMYLINKYVYYCVNDEKIPMTEELLVEHNWSFKEIGDFLFSWAQISD